MADFFLTILGFHVGGVFGGDVGSLRSKGEEEDDQASVPVKWNTISVYLAAAAFHLLERKRKTEPKLVPQIDKLCRCSSRILVKIRTLIATPRGRRMRKRARAAHQLLLLLLLLLLSAVVGVASAPHVHPVQGAADRHPTVPHLDGGLISQSCRGQQHISSTCSHRCSRRQIIDRRTSYTGQWSVSSTTYL